jgi:hypothetical protein
VALYGRVTKERRLAMVMHPGERSRCINQNCGCIVVVELGSSSDKTNPRCSCGSIMKKECKSPILSYLDFLHLEPPLVAAKKPEQG